MEIDTWSRGVKGPLAPYAVGFAGELERLGYTPHSAGKQLRLFAHLSRWLTHAGLKAPDVTATVLKEYLQARRDAGYMSYLSERALQRILAYLREVGVVPGPASPEGPVEELLQRYRAYLTEERGLTAGTIVGYERSARHFLSERVTAGVLDMHELSGADVLQFVRRESSLRSIGAAKNMMNALRSLLRFLHVAGEAPARSEVVPAVAGWKAAGLPRALPPDQVQHVLASCERTTDSGRRDYAMLILLAQLGLRAGEVTKLELEDLDWLHGELVIRGKGNRLERLPLPHAVGEALSDYIIHGRPQGESRRVFLRTVAPAGGLMTIGTVTRVLRRACRRAGLAPVGTHWLRRSAATQMLWAGGSLLDVSQVLRHRDLATTALYAKIDRTSLCELARPWPTGVAA